MANWPRPDTIFPMEGRDQQEAAKAWYNDPLRVQHRQLLDENMELKKLLRKNGISWSSKFTFRSGKQLLMESGGPAAKRRKTRHTRSSTPPPPPQLPVLPVEIQLQILELALTSRHPIIDPLTRADPGAMSAKERNRGNQVAIGFLTTCRAYLVEGRRFFWENNTFTFTNHHTLRNFCNLSLQYRQHIKHVNFRILAKFYDDEVRDHTIPYPNKKNHKKLHRLRVEHRAKEQSMARGGFRSYTWTQTVDFLDALRPPYDPSHNLKKLPPPRLLPNLESLRIDFVNFADNFLHIPGYDLHEMAVHNLGSTLNELMVTGLPAGHAGSRACSELRGLVKDDGLFLKSKPAIVQAGTQVRHMGDCRLEPSAVQTWKVLAKEVVAAKKAARAKDDDSDLDLDSDSDSDSDFDSDTVDPRIHHPGHHDLPDMPPAPEEEGHPESDWKSRRTIWKRVPVSRDSEERKWVEFDRILGIPLNKTPYSEEDDHYDPKDLVCDGCGCMHAPSDWSEE
ncbi:hypothetical protein B0H63DRAFT_106792 [Podospora didyma]|uniref:Uncharacterized protein n=1 Tax=Podospora didyma TaxID=330526 RepID=A0AAE0NYJ5_9PEZI|nr:hypothetical protein B0H63DRAFT_106792 [Podospora didyma]